MFSGLVDLSTWLILFVHPDFSPPKQLPSEKDSPETLRAKMGTGNDVSSNVPVPTMNSKFGKKIEEFENNPFGFAEDNEDHYW